MFFFASIVHFVVYKKAQMTFKLSSQDVSIVSGMKMKNQQNIPFVHLKCIFLGTKKQQTKLFEWIATFTFKI